MLNFVLLIEPIGTRCRVKLHQNLTVVLIQVTGNFLIQKYENSSQHLKLKGQGKIRPKSAHLYDSS